MNDLKKTYLNSINRPWGWLLKCFLFVAVLFLVDRELFLFFRAVFDRMETVGLSQMQRADADIVVLGSSRAFHHYDCKVIADLTKESVFNTGRDGLGVPYMRGVCDRLLDRHTPKTIIIELDASSLMARYYSRQMKRVACLAPYIDDSQVIADMIYSQGPRQRIKYLSRSFRYNGQPMYILYELLKRRQNVNGFEPIDKTYFPPTGQPVRPAKTARNTPIQLSDEFIAMLTEMIQTAHKKDVDVLLVTSPRWGGLSAYSGADLEAISHIRKLAEQQSVPYLLITADDYPVFTDSSLFADPSHLNRKGAALFSRIVADILNSRTPEIDPRP